MSERNLIRCLKTLEELKELTLVRGNGRGRGTAYQITLDGAERVTTTTPFIKVERVTNSAQKVTSPTPFTVEKGDKSGSERVTELGERVTNLVKKGDTEPDMYLTIMNQEETMIVEPKKDMYLSQVQEVFVYWQVQLNHSRSDLNAKRKTAVRARLVQGYSVDEIKQAIDGCRSSPWHMGDNPNRTVYDDLTLICRDDNHLNMFISKVGNNGKSQAGKTGNGADRGTAQRTTEDYGIRDCKVL